MRTLQTSRLLLEPQCADHAAEMFVVLADPAIYTYENSAPESLEWLTARYLRLESRSSPDGSEQWLNWVLRLLDGRLIGYVQATLNGNARAQIAYELNSGFWGQGFALEAVRAMIDELKSDKYLVNQLAAVLKSANGRSKRLLERLAFECASPVAPIEDDELFMRRSV